MSRPQTRGSTRPPSAGMSRPMSGRSNKAFVGHDELPAAMESEVYVDGRVVTNDQAYDQAEVDTQNAEQGCWNKFKKGLRSVWATRHTEDTQENKELYITTTLRELIIYHISDCAYDFDLLHDGRDYVLLHKGYVGSLYGNRARGCSKIFGSDFG